MFKSHTLNNQVMKPEHSATYVPFKAGIRKQHLNRTCTLLSKHLLMIVLWTGLCVYVNRKVACRYRKNISEKGIIPCVNMVVDSSGVTVAVGWFVIGMFSSRRIIQLAAMFVVLYRWNAPPAAITRNISSSSKQKSSRGASSATHITIIFLAISKRNLQCHSLSHAVRRSPLYKPTV